MENLHGHAFLAAGHDRNARRTLIVVAITAAMMVVEIVAGTLFGSMALVADGWHMATHAGALGIAAAAYTLARRHAEDPRLAFGTGKVGDLAAFASAVSLAIVALLIAVESVARVVTPEPIRYAEAIPVAVLGLVVNIACMWVLGGDGHDHAHDHSGGAGHDHAGHDHAGHERAGHDHASHAHASHAHAGHAHAAGDGHDHAVAGAAKPGHASKKPVRSKKPVHDNNMRAAYIHVATDALTSVLAIAALVCGTVFGWWWFDPAIGIVGAVVIAAWAVSLMRASGAVLIDASPAPAVRDAVVRRLEAHGDTVTDIHLWSVGPGHLAAIVALASDSPESPAAYKARLAEVARFSHVTVEVDRRARRLGQAA